jgi:hypothetical protein
VSRPLEKDISSAHCSSEAFLKKLVGKTDIEDALLKLGKLMEDEVRMVAALGLKAVHGVCDSVQAVEDKIIAVVEGACTDSTTYPCSLWRFLLLDDEKKMGAIRHLANDLGKLNRL